MFQAEQEEVARFLTLVGRTDLFAYYGVPANEAAERRARVVSDRRRWAQQNQSNPKYRREALFLIRNAALLQRLIVDECLVYAEHVRTHRRAQQLELFDTFVANVKRAGPLGPGGETTLVHYGLGLGLSADAVEARLTTLRTSPTPMAPRRDEELTEDVGPGWGPPPIDMLGYLPPPPKPAAPRPPLVMTPFAAPIVSPPPATLAAEHTIVPTLPPRRPATRPASAATTRPNAENTWTWEAPVPAERPGFFARLWAWLQALRPPEPALALVPVAAGPGNAPIAPNRITLPRVQAPALAAWDGVDVLPSLSADHARIHILEHLYPLLDHASTDGDAAFLDRLIRACSSAHLQFPLFPDSALKLDALLRDEDSPIDEVSDVIRHEPALVQRVWEQSCSAVYGSKPPANLDAAIVRIGRRTLWRIGMRACVNAPVFRVHGWQKQANEVRNLGIVAAEVAEKAYPDAEPYLPALLHGVGRLLVFRAALSRPNVPEPSRPLVEGVARKLQSALGVLIAGSWQLGPGVCAGIGSIGDPTKAPEEWRPTAYASRVGMVAAHVVGTARQGEAIDGIAALTGLGLSARQAADALRSAEEAWSEVPEDAAA